MAHPDAADYAAINSEVLDDIASVEVPEFLDATPELGTDGRPQSADPDKPIFTKDNIVLIDLDQITVAEQAEVEKLSGQPFGACLTGNAVTGTLLQALIFVSARKTHPDTTFADAGNALPGTYGWVLEPNDEGGYDVPLQALAARSITGYASVKRIWDLSAAAAETTTGAENGVLS